MDEVYRVYVPPDGDQKDPRTWALNDIPSRERITWFEEGIFVRGAVVRWYGEVRELGAETLYIFESDPNLYRMRFALRHAVWARLAARVLGTAAAAPPCHKRPVVVADEIDTLRALCGSMTGLLRENQDALTQAAAKLEMYSHTTLAAQFRALATKNDSAKHDAAAAAAGQPIPELSRPV